MGESVSSAWFQRLRERGVVRVAASYAVIAWLLLQIAGVVFEPLGVPRWVMVALIVAAVIGFPVAVTLAWFLEFGDGGISVDSAAEGVARPVAHGVRRYADVAIIAILVITVSVLVTRQTRLGSSEDRDLAIAVMPFQNLSTAADSEILAQGIAESVLHQLASLAELDVISRTSSFALENRQRDAREIGRQLGARYLLEGSVQSDRKQMRVMTQLIDAQTGVELWSMRFDRTPGDIFEVQDEIALQVTQALELALDPEATARMSGQGTTNLDAYLAFLQGRALLANGNVTEVKTAIEHFERSVKIDPKFSSAYVKLAQARLTVAEYEVTGNRRERFEAALEASEGLVERALAADPDNGDAYLQRAYLETFTDLTTAEADYRHGLELSPNSVEGYIGLAGVIYATPSRRNEVLDMLEHARKIDPLEPSHDVAKAVFLMYERCDMKGADALLVDVVTKHPRYSPALARLAELRLALTGQVASGIRYGEEALALDPLLDNVRWQLINGYLNLGERRAAEQLAASPRDDESAPRLWLLIEDREWKAAGELTYSMLERGTATPISMGPGVDAIRMHARATGDFTRAEAALTDLSGAHWSTNGEVILPEGASPADLEYTFALADVLIASGQDRKGRDVLAAVIARWREQVQVLKRPEFWYRYPVSAALAMSGDRDESIAMLERELAERYLPSRTLARAGTEPAYATLRSDPRFKAIVLEYQANAEEQRRELARLRAEGLVPDRGTRSAPTP